MSSFSWWVLLARGWGFSYNKNRKVWSMRKGFQTEDSGFIYFFDNNGEKIGVDSSWREYLEQGK